MLNNSKMMLGAALALLVLSAPLSMLSTAGVEAAVEENFETFPADEACANSDCTEAEADWASSTGERSYYAWNLTNPGAAEPVYEKVGPFDYDITYTREILDYNETAGTMQYSESKVFTCAEDTRNPCDTLVTTTNIPFQPQVTGATGPAIAGIMDLTKAGFAAGLVGKEMESFGAGKVTAEGIATSYGGIQMGAATGGTPVDAGTASMMLGVGWFDAFDAYFASLYGSTYTQAIQGGQLMAAGGPGNESAITFAGNSSIGNLSYAFESAMMPTGEDAALTGMQGVLILAGHCNAYPTEDYSAVAVDALNAPAFTTGTMQRAGIWGYASADINATIATDYAVCLGVGGTFANVHGGGDAEWFMDTTGTAVNASTRIMNYLGVDLDNAVATTLLFGGKGTAMPIGLLATNAVGSESPTAFGIAAFATMDKSTATATYGISDAEYDVIAPWVANWLISETSLNMILLGGSGTINAEQFVNQTLGGLDPINGGYLTYSLNLGGAWGTALAPTSPQGADYVSVSPEIAGNMLYGPLGVATDSGAVLFLHGELMGETPPINFSTMGAGAPTPWTDATVSALYGIDANAAAALRVMVRDAIFTGFVPDYLVGLGSDGPYKTQTVNQWLFGWYDPISHGASDDPTAADAGWTKLETNLTYYGSNNVSTGPATTYTVCTGHNPDCDKGETVLEDGSNELAWHNTAMAMATYGAVGVELLNETTGGFLTGDGDKVDAGGYAIAAITCSGTSEVKGIPVDDCSASVDPTTRPITAKLIKSLTLLDSMTPALPVYFGTEITMQSEELSGLIIAGESTSTFYLDTRGQLDRATTPAMTDLQPVFQIVQSSEIGDSDAEDMESAIVQNQNGLSYWTNFDVPTDYVALLLYLGAVACLVLAAMATNKEDE